MITLTIVCNGSEYPVDLAERAKAMDALVNRPKEVTLKSALGGFYTLPCEGISEVKLRDSSFS